MCYYLLTHCCCFRWLRPPQKMEHGTWKTNSELDDFSTAYKAVVHRGLTPLNNRWRLMAANGSLFFRQKEHHWFIAIPAIPQKMPKKVGEILLASGAKSLSKSALTIVFWGVTTNPWMDFFTTKHLTIPDLLRTYLQVLSARWRRWDLPGWDVDSVWDFSNFSTLQQINIDPGR